MSISQAVRDTKAMLEAGRRQVRELDAAIKAKQIELGRMELAKERIIANARAEAARILEEAKQ
jgi:hypothetical protein